ncbi:hypothetical protein G7050_13035 [Dysgonomonas sp. HDW5A]|uniref:hypothetical protein n=1 Tax=Dysgonomonas sp. HDW5A TaxID=2714926 RepID=UPI00140BE096|nr:hypothetical protein [Dysgonomonas sp. HDW5A]QIK60707.1 hypothetical protein G7050_13035 [Dysgonomonas sp. HDW5A]
MNSIYKWIFFFLCITINSSAQVGLNTSNPQSGVLHIDAKGNNNATEAPASDQTIDDVMISPAGNIAIGHTTPSYKLDIWVRPSGTSKPAFRLEDGTEGNTKILLSDASGNAYWGYPGEIPLIRGVYTRTINYTIPSISPSLIYANMYAYAYIKLPKGRWVVMVDQRVDPASGSYGTSYQERSFFRLTFSDNSLSGDGTLYPANGAGVSKDIEGSLNGTATTGSLISSNVNFRTASIVSGFIIINNRTNGIKTYYLKLVNAAYPNNLNLAGRVLTTANPAHAENRIIAMPLQ